MNKENKILHLAFRISIIVTWVMTNISLFMLISGFKNLDTKDLNEKNFGERLLKIIGDFADKTTLYYVTMALICVCLVLCILTRYKTRLVSYIFRIVGLVFSLIVVIGGVEYISAVGSCKGLSLEVAGTKTEEIASALSSAGMTDNVDHVAKVLTDKNEVGAAFGGYLIPMFILFILAITSIHCLVKRSDPNKAGGSED